MKVLDQTKSDMGVAFSSPPGFVICDVQLQLGSAIMPATGTVPFWGGTLRSQTELVSTQVNDTDDKPSGRVTVQLIPDTSSAISCRRPGSSLWYCKGAGNSCVLR